jgi:hypothetical protein
MADVKTGVSIPVAAVSATGSIGDIAVSYRTNFSVTHALSAARLAREAATLERTAVTPDPAIGMIRACATGAVMVSVAFLEGTINEFFLDLVEDKAPDSWKATLPEDRRSLAVRLWGSAGVERLPTLAKFDAALDLFAGDDRCSGRPCPCQARNAQRYRRRLDKGGREALERNARQLRAKPFHGQQPSVSRWAIGRRRCPVGLRGVPGPH